MGLGPPVCTECKVVMAFRDDLPHWYCPKCGTSETDTHLWELEISEDDLKGYPESTLELLPPSE